jgi:hypothetical protein
MISLPAHLWHPINEFAADYERACAIGAEELRKSKVAFVGLARNCADPLAMNLARLEDSLTSYGQWALHVEANDCDDKTPEVLAEFSKRHPQASFHYATLGRGQYGSEFAGRRTIAMAEYRNRCVAWLKATHPDADYVVAIDWDQWGGWNHDGLVNGIGQLQLIPDAFGMSSVGLFQHDFGGGINWYQYDCWALRLNSYWDDYTAGAGGWKYSWLPPVGSPPVPVCSAFGGLTVYRGGHYRMGVYDGSADCEHVAFHRSIAEPTRMRLYLNPSQRCVMHWRQDAQHGIDSVPAAPGVA